MPSLNNRIEDIPYLIEYFIISLSKDLGKNILNFSPDTLAIFQTYDWPGNLRQLKNILEWLLIMYGDNVDNLITPSNLPSEFLNYKKNVKQDNYNLSHDLDLQLKDARKLFEANYLKSQLIRFKGNISRTSNFVGMDRSALHRKLKELNIDVNDIS